MELNVTNVNQAFNDGIHWLLKAGIEEDSRNGAVLVSPEPVLTTYSRPWERVLFGALRDANPFFHLMEALWMMAGRNDVEWPTFFNSKFNQFSDDGTTFNGAYGHRWRTWFGYDQLTELADTLRLYPTTRRAVLTMWDAMGDDVRISDTGMAHGAGASKDVPCNTHAYLDVRGGFLNLTVCNRSNDAVWGAYGANAVHFSVLQEVLAKMVGVQMGVYRQFSNNLHAYLNVFDRERLRAMAVQCGTQNLYEDFDNLHRPVISTPPDEWFADLKTFLTYPGMQSGLRDPFFTGVAVPMYRAWYMRKNHRDSKAALEHAWKIEAPDWRVACVDWISRRENARLMTMPENRPQTSGAAGGGANV